MRVVARDLPTLERLFERIEREEGSADPTLAVPALRRSLAAWDALASDTAWVLCARAGDEFVGYASVVRIPKLDARLGHLFVDELHVLREHRRDGVATALVEAVSDLADRLGYAGVRLLVRPENAVARALYAGLGFTESPTALCERIGSGDT